MQSVQHARATMEIYHQYLCGRVLSAAVCIPIPEAKGKSVRTGRACAATSLHLESGSNILPACSFEGAHTRLKTIADQLLRSVFSPRRRNQITGIRDQPRWDPGKRRGFQAIGVTRGIALGASHPGFDVVVTTKVEREAGVTRRGWERRGAKVYSHCETGAGVVVTQQKNRDR